MLCPHFSFSERCQREIDQVFEEKERVSFEDKDRMPFMQVM